MPIDIKRYVEDYPSLLFNGNEPGVLEIVIANQRRVNAATEDMHRHLAHVWRSVDIDEAVRVVLIRGEGANFSSAEISR